VVQFELEIYNWLYYSFQVIVQRALAGKTYDHAKAGTILCAFIKILPLFILVFPGMIARILFPGKYPARSIPARSIPARSIPARNIPARNIPARSIPDRSIPAGSIPARSIPDRSIPAGSIPARSIPDRSIPARSIPARNIPLHELFYCLYYI